MDLQKIIFGLTLLGRDAEQREVVERIKSLSQGQGGVLLVEGSSQYGQKNIVRNMVTNSGLPYFLGYGSRIPVPYDVFRFSFSKIFEDFAAHREQNLQGINKLEKAIYKGIIGKTTRRFARSNLSLEPKSQTDLHITFSRHLLNEDLPAIFYCEDLQWAETSSLELLLFLIKSAMSTSAPILFILQYDLEDKGMVTPFALRQRNVSIMQQLKAMKSGIKRRTGLRPKEFVGQLQDLEYTQKLVLQPVSEKEIERVFKKILGYKLLSSTYVNALCYLAQGSGFFVGELLLYLSRNVLEFRSQKWQLKYDEHQIKLFDDIDYFTLANLEDLGEEVFQELQRAALLHYPISKKDWAESSSLSSENFKNAAANAVKYGILKQIADGYYVFNNDYTKYTLIASCSSEEERHLHTNIAASLTESHPAYVHLFHWKNSEKPEMSLDHMVRAGIENEKMMAYENAYFLYEEGAKLFPEAREMFLEISKDMLECSKDKEKKKDKDFLEPLLALVKLYRIAGLIEATPLLSDEDIALWKKIIYDYSPDKTFPDFAWLLLFLLKSYTASVKTYFKPEVEKLALLLIRELCPGKDHQTKTIFLQALVSFSQNDEQRNRLAVNIEKWGSLQAKQGNLLDAAVKYLDSYYVYLSCKDYFNCARALHLTIKLCQENIHNNHLMPLLQVEALRLLACNYQSWSHEEQKKEQEIQDEFAPKKHLNYALQSVAAFLDSARFGLERYKCPWLTIYGLQRAYNFSEEMYVENDLVKELLDQAKNEWEIIADESYDKSAVIIANSSDVGAACVIGEAVLREGVSVDIDVECCNDLEKAVEKMSQNDISFLLLQPHSKFSFMSTAEVMHIIASYQEEKPSGWFIREHGDHIQFIVWETTSSKLLATCLKFLDEKIVRSYV
ncbi:AAA family ATPase [Candidatus Uabimicrobium amorphum]|uniref:Orc1-like AAA ATPase domain-containing protein n=1 Tax=Uabimicrobium amorphum TaxID=2596890 RepID=A0A5S9IRL9_UABAM|nr:ATP-binding protein [Candidatus Uabimicrobium amorphum]BBM85890.1 hypothetical protein UABAM_04272 [Candidatus Uabimicrobium amorphum]